MAVIFPPGSVRAAAFTLLAANKSTVKWLIHLGGPSLIVLGLFDNSAIPLPGTMDIGTIVLSAHHREPWLYYAIMATIGAVLGGYLTYDMARKTGKESLDKRFAKSKVAWACSLFDRWGFAAVAIPAVLPPPFPIVPMLVAAGALQYPTKKFLSALSVGRGIRYTILAYLGARYGGHIVSFLTRYYKPSLIVLIVLLVFAVLYGLLEFQRNRKSGHQQAQPSNPETGRRIA